MSVDASSRDRTPRPGGGSCPPPKTSYLVLWVQGTALAAAYGREWPPLEIAHALLSYEMAPPGRFARTFPHLVSPLPRRGQCQTPASERQCTPLTPSPVCWGRACPERSRRAGMGFLTRARTIHKGLPDGSRWGEANSEAPRLTFVSKCPGTASLLPQKCPKNVSGPSRSQLRNETN